MENKILIVDDAIFMRMIIKEALSKSGYNNLIEANDGEEACNIFKYEKPDLMLLDITMPKKDGLEVLREIKKLDSSAKGCNVLCNRTREYDCRSHKTWSVRFYSEALQNRNIS